MVRTRAAPENANDPHNFVWLNALAVSHLMQDDAEGSLRLAQASLKVRPQWRPAVRTMAACYAALGHETQAQDWREQLARTPPVAGDTLGAMWRRNPQWAARMAGWGVSPPVRRTVSPFRAVVSV